MFQKIVNILSIASFVLITSTLGASYMGYKYVTSEQFKAKIMNQVIENVKGMMPNVLDNALPKTTGISIFGISNYKPIFLGIANVLSIISFVMVASMSGGAYFGYKYVTSEQFKARVMNEILGNVKGMMPNVLDNALPKTTGPSMAIPKMKL